MENEKDCKKISLNDLEPLSQKLESLLAPYGLELTPFKIGWYNEQVSSCFKLPYHPDTLAFVVISTPSMFEKAFIPYVVGVDCLRSSQDPLDQCLVERLGPIKKEFPDGGVTVIHDFEMTPNKRPKILVQTAGHVSGAVRYYQRKDVTKDPWEAKKKMFGVCLHPHFGGWFALRGVAIFSSFVCPDMPQQKPREILNNEEELVELLKRYNDHWEDWTFRDIIPVKEKYSEQQREYFSTKPGERNRLLEKYRHTVKRSA